MNPLQNLKQIAANQKTITTSRLLPLLKEIELMHARTVEELVKTRRSKDKINMNYNNALNKLQRAYAKKPPDSDA
jgi:hypothetical protein